MYVFGPLYHVDEISVDQEEKKCWLIFIEDCHTQGGI